MQVTGIKPALNFVNALTWWQHSLLFVLTGFSKVPQVWQQSLYRPGKPMQNPSAIHTQCIVGRMTWGRHVLILWCLSVTITLDSTCTYNTCSYHTTNDFSIIPLLICELYTSLIKDGFRLTVTKITSTLVSCYTQICKFKNYGLWMLSPKVKLRLMSENLMQDLQHYTRAPEFLFTLH